MMHTYVPSTLDDVLDRDWLGEALGREDILEKGCHMTCPASIEETAKLYNPNMKMDVLAIPPRVDDGHVCCKWKLSMRTPDDPEYVSVELTSRTADT